MSHGQSVQFNKINCGKGLGEGEARCVRADPRLAAVLQERDLKRFTLPILLQTI